MDPLIIKQGTTRLVALTGLRDAAGGVFDPTGWIVRAVARAGIWAAVASEWHSAPTITQYLAEVVNADPACDSSVIPGEKWIYLHIDPAVSDTWTWSDAVLDIEIREPSTGNEEAFSTQLRLVPATVRA